MFKNLVNFQYQRSGKEAIGFYLAFLLLNIIVGATLGAVFSQSNLVSSVSVGAYGAVATQLIAGIFILKERKRYQNFWYIVLFLLSVMLSRLGGGLLGIIPLAYLTTR